MPKQYTLKIILNVLQSKGFFFISQSGSHAKYRSNSTPPLTVIVPIHGKEVPYGTFRSILRQAKLKEDDFLKRKK